MSLFNGRNLKECGIHPQCEMEKNGEGYIQYNKVHINPKEFKYTTFYGYKEIYFIRWECKSEI